MSKKDSEIKSERDEGLRRQVEVGMTSLSFRHKQTDDQELEQLEDLLSPDPGLDPIVDSRGCNYSRE